MCYPIHEGCELIKPSVSDCCVAAPVVHSLVPAFTFDNHYINYFTVVYFSINAVYLLYAHSQNTSYGFTGDFVFTSASIFQIYSGSLVSLGN